MLVIRLLVLVLAGCNMLCIISLFGERRKVYLSQIG